MGFLIVRVEYECEDSNLKRRTSGFREKLTRKVATCKAHD